MTVRYAVTFEFDERPPITHRGTIAASRLTTCICRAVKDAQLVLRPRHWSSMNCVLLERISDGLDDSDDSDEPVVSA